MRWFGDTYGSILWRTFCNVFKYENFSVIFKRGSIIPRIISVTRIETKVRIYFIGTFTLENQANFAN